MLSKRIIACLDVRDGQVVKGINFEGLRTAGDPAELARRYNARRHRRARDPRHHRDARAAPRAGRHHPRGRARAVHSARRRRRHPYRSRRRGGRRGRRRQGEPEHRGAVEPIAHHDTRRALRQPGRARRDRRETGRRPRRRSTSRSGSTRRDIATPWSGRAKPKRAAPARSFSPPSIATAPRSGSTAR